MSGFDQIKYQNDYNKQKYERMTILFPKGKKERVKNRATILNKSVSGYLNDLIDNDLKSAH